MNSRMLVMAMVARFKPFSGALINHQVNVALTVLYLLVLHAVELVRHGALGGSSLKKNQFAVALSREFSSFGKEQMPLSGGRCPQVTKRLKRS
jgi:hypothetical protein